MSKGILDRMKSVANRAKETKSKIEDIQKKRRTKKRLKLEEKIQLKTKMLQLKKKELQKLVDRAIEKLPVEQKQVLLLREHSELSFKEIAQLINCPLNTVLGRMRYALLNLKKLIQMELNGGISDVL